LVGGAVGLVTSIIGLVPLDTARAIARAAGRFAIWAGVEGTRVTRINLGRCFGLEGSALDALVRASLEHTACLVAEAGMLAHWSPERIEATIVDVQGLERLRAVRAGGRGVLILAPHFGNWEILTFVLGPDGMVAVYDPPRIDGLEVPIRTSRERFGARLVPTSRAGLRTLYRTLRSGGLAGILPDQVPEREAGEYAPFFGQPALTMTFGHRLIRETAPEVFIASARRVEGGFAVRFDAAPRELYSAHPRDHVIALNRAIEQLVQTDPAQYQWEYKRFKRQPEGCPQFYPKR
jgi:KDO2-lipid IV(A) lauroyltransferase